MSERRALLDRPALPAIADRIGWPRSVSIFGDGARELAEALAARLRELGREARVIRVELRRAPGSSIEGDPAIAAVVHGHPDALRDALAPLVEADAITVGVGSAFAAAAKAELTIWIRAGESAAALGEVERTLASEARLVLEGPRLTVAAALARALAGIEDREDL